MDIKNKTIIVSGAASGMGLAVAQALRENGATPVLLDLNPKVNHVAADLNTQAFVLDVSNDNAVADAFATLKQQAIPVSGLVNCAGIAPAARLLGKKGPMPPEHFHKVIHVNLLGSFLLMQQAVQLMATNEPNPDGERGVIINTASVAAFDGQIGQVAYSASKGAIVGMTLPAARDLASLGIRVMCIAPGIMDTPMMQGMPSEVRESLSAQTPFPKRLGKASEYADLALHIFQNSMLNGETIRLDGAIRMQPR